jgi:hypothetical protein
LNPPPQRHRRVQRTTLSPEYGALRKEELGFTSCYSALIAQPSALSF